jgi:hypothetical protein
MCSISKLSSSLGKDILKIFELFPFFEITFSSSLRNTLQRYHHSEYLIPRRICIVLLPTKVQTREGWPLPVETFFLIIY